MEWFSGLPQGIARLQPPHKHLEHLGDAIALFSSQLEMSIWDTNGDNRAS